jgi:hypothetical protein
MEESKMTKRRSNERRKGIVPSIQINCDHDVKFESADQLLRMMVSFIWKLALDVEQMEHRVEQR